MKLAGRILLPAVGIAVVGAAVLFFSSATWLEVIGALVLIIGVLVSMFSAIVVTRSIMRVVVRQPWARKASLYGLREGEFAAMGATRPGGRREARARV